MKTTSTLMKGVVSLCSFVIMMCLHHAIHAEDDLFSIVCPADVTVNCQEELWDLTGYGNAYYHDYTGTHNAGAPYVHYNLSSCNVGTITRTWTVEDYNWVQHTCTQTITVTATGGFSQYNIHWPLPSIELSGCNPAYTPADLPYGYGYPTYDYAECSLIGVSYEDVIFNITPQCKKVLRTYKVIDWCTYNGNGSHPYGGLYTFTQTIKISKGEIPEVNYNPEIVFQSFNCYNHDVVAPPLYVEPSTCGGDFTISNNSPYATSPGADLSGTYPIGTTKVTFTIHYGCTGRVFKTVSIVVLDSKLPQPYCLGEIVTTLMPMDDNFDGIPEDGMVEIWAKDLDLGSTSPCGHYPIKYSFSEDPNDNFKLFTCENVGDNFIRMYVTDSKGNQNWCLVNVVIQNNSANIPDCQPGPPPNYNVSGNIMMSNQQRVSEAHVSLRSINPISTTWTGYNTVSVMVSDSTLNAQGYWEVRRRYENQNIFGTHTTIGYGEMAIATNDNGEFILDDALLSGEEYMITAAYDGDDQSVNYADVKALLYHLQGKVPFTNQYQYLAADINENGIIDYNDLTQLLQYVNGINNVFSTNRSWRLFDASHIFNNPEDIISGDCPEALYVFTNNEDVSNKNFIAVRIGNITEEVIILAPDSMLSEALQQSSDFDNSLDLEALVRIFEADATTINVSPNPFDQLLNIELNTITEGTITIEILDISGRQLQRQQINAKQGMNTFRLYVEELMSGMIICHITSQNINQTFKLIKE